MSDDEKKFPGNAYTKITPVNKDVVQKAEKKPDKTEKKRTPGKEKKKTFGERIADNFLSIDKDEIKEHFLFDWLFPEFISVIDNFLRTVLLGDNHGIQRTNRGGSRRRNFTPYNSISEQNSRDRSSGITRQNFRKIQVFYDEIDDAEELRDDIRESLETSSSGYVTVREFFSLANMPTNWAMNDWGWHDLEEINITRTRDGYLLEMPPAEALR